MYPRNAASPERLAVGAVVQISDGAVQTSGVSIAVRGQGGASGAGGGTTAYDNGIVEYTPIQAETDFTSFVVIAYKTGCIPVAQTVVTTASATPGYAGVDWSKVGNPTTTVGLSGTTIKTATDVETDTADIQSRLGTPSNLGSGATVAANLVDIEAQTDDIGAAGAGLTAVPWNAAWDTEVQSEVADALTAYGVSTQVSVDDLPTNAELATALGTADDAVLAAIAALNNLSSAQAQTAAAAALTAYGVAATGDAMTLAANAMSAAALATDAVEEIADGVLNRDMATGTDSGSTTVRTMRQALRFLRNKWTIVGTTLTVYKEDDSTTSWAGVVTTDAAADPITATDPGGP